MFRNTYQGGAVFDIFSGQGKDPIAKWKLCGGPSAIYKEYNKEVKGFVYCLGGSSQTVKMQMPESGKMTLGLIQRFLVLQVNIPQCHDFSTELVITDSEHQKRRLHLSTVHKELSATLLHAKIPYVGLKRNTWSTLCIDLASLASELFKGFLSLDGITLFATCKVRRIFTMKAEPAAVSDDGTAFAGLVNTVPRCFQYPPDVIQCTQVLNIETLLQAETKTDPFSSDSVSDQSPTARSTSYRRTRPQGILHTASGSRVSGLSPQTGRKSSATSDRMERSVPFTQHTGSPSSILDQKIAAQTQDIAELGADLLHGQYSHILQEGASCKLQSHHPKKGVFDKQGNKRLRVRSATKERLTSADAESAGQMSISRKKCAQQPLTPTEKHLPADETKCTPAKQSPGVASTPAESCFCLIPPDLSPDLRVWNSWGSNEGSEPQLTLQEGVFTFSSHPHSPKRGQGQGDQGKKETGDEQLQSRNGRRHHPQPEDDFIGSESDEDKSYIMFQHQKRSISCPATPRTADAARHVQLESHSESPNMSQTSPKQLRPPSTSMQFPSVSGAEPARMVPIRCLSPNRQSPKSEKGNRVLDGNSIVSICKKLLQEGRLSDSTHYKEEEYETLKTVASSHYALEPHDSLRMHEDDDEELRMLASLKREQEEVECRVPDLSASQIHQCDVSISMSSDDTSTWTHISMPVNQGHHYLKEMNPLLQSNPREWMDVLSPPIMPPSQQRRSGNTQNNLEMIFGFHTGEDGLGKEEENEDEYLNLLYDPCLNCYFDPKTGKYYELA
ncbi:protein CFAP20DC [Odontesthes bonariensis]|uniref:protein CFAP20DC n=1 Tax=Odontesthes bonariensis TaxID=219752 RepID=UPI003F586E96